MEFGNYAEYEKRCAGAWRVAGAPLVLTRIYESMAGWAISTSVTTMKRLYTASFEAVDGTNVWGALDVDTGKVLTAHVGRKAPF
jgi:hypothetical protein